MGSIPYNLSRRRLMRGANPRPSNKRPPTLDDGAPEVKKE